MMSIMIECTSVVLLTNIVENGLDSSDISGFLSWMQSSTFSPWINCLLIVWCLVAKMLTSLYANKKIVTAKFEWSIAFLTGQRSRWLVQICVQVCDFGLYYFEARGPDHRPAHNCKIRNVSTVSGFTKMAFVDGAEYCIQCFIAEV